MKKISEQKKVEYKFCHTADWHLDYFQYQKKERWEDFIKAANDCSKQMIAENPHFIIHCGDLFHQFKPSPGALRCAIQILNKFKQAKIPFYIIRGNHDASKAQAQRFGGTILKFLDELGFLHYLTDEMVPINEHITLTGIGEHGKTTGEVIEEVLRNNPLNQSKFNILALHGYLQGQVSDSIYDISGYQLASTGYNYIALGHYHKQWEEKENNIYCSGSTEQTSINDWGPSKGDNIFHKAGFYAINVTQKEDEKTWDLDVIRKEFNIRPKGHYRFNVTDMSIEEIAKKASEFVKKHDREGAIIRFDFEGELPLGKQLLINFSNLQAIKESKALHVIVNQQISSKELSQANSNLTTEEALIELLEKSYRFGKKDMNKWIDIVNEAVKVLGYKAISSEEAEEIQIAYQTISDLAKKISTTDIREKNKQSDKTSKNPKKEQEKNSSSKEIENNNIMNTNFKTRQSNLSYFIKEGEK